MRQGLLVLIVAASCGPRPVDDRPPVHVGPPGTSPPAAPAPPTPAPSPAPPPPSRAAASIPVAADETLEIQAPVPEASGTAPLRLEHPGLSIATYALAVELAWTDATLDGAVEVELAGPGVREVQPLRLTSPQRVIFRQRPTTPGTYVVRARTGSAERSLAIEVTENRMFATTPHGALPGDYRLVARGVVKGAVGGVPLWLHRALFVHGTSSLVVDVSTEATDEPSVAKLVAALGPLAKVGPRELHVTSAGGRSTVRWLARHGTGTSTYALRVDAPALGPAELQVIDAYAGSHPAVRLGRFAPTRCTADARRCCLPDGRVVRFMGCQPSYPDDVPGSYERGRDGFCKPVPCNLRCLPADARIATPQGDRAVASLRAGDLVWTADARGRRVEAPLRRVSSLARTGPHELVVLTLADGRVLRASPGHPIGTTTVGALVAGASVDGVPVLAIGREPYTGAATWDLLPEGATGDYWADGVRVGSTLE